MCTLQAYMQCYDGFSEVISNEVEYNELILENFISQLLLGFFDEVMVNVNIHFCPHTQMELQHCNIQIQAQCENQINASQTDQSEYIELNAEIMICSILMELFDSVIVHNFTFIPLSRNYEYAQRSVSRV